jgi:hypothetical protein
MNFRTALPCALLAAISAPAFAAKPAVPDVLIVPAGKGGDKIEISFDDKHLYVTSGSFDVTGTNARGDRYYRKGASTSGGEPLWKEENGADGFKIRDPGGKLLWKVKFDNDKVKIADNEEMTNAWSVKMHPDHAKAYDAKNIEIGEAKANKDSGKVKIKDAHGKELFVVEVGTRMTAAYGVLLLKDIPEQQRELLAGEVFIHGK